MRSLSTHFYVLYLEYYKRKKKSLKIQKFVDQLKMLRIENIIKSIYFFFYLKNFKDTNKLLKFDTYKYLKNLNNGNFTKFLRK